MSMIRLKKLGKPKAEMMEDYLAPVDQAVSLTSEGGRLADCAAGSR